MKTGRSERGTVLIVAIGLIAALAIIGATMINVARVDRMAAQSFRQSQEMELAKTSALEYLGQRLADDYWSQAKTGIAVDEPTRSGSILALLRPGTNGHLQVVGNRDEAGLYKTSTTSAGMAGSWYNLPLSAYLPEPGKPGSAGNVGDGVPFGDNHELTIPISGNREIKVSVTVLDLCSRYNLNIHGSGTAGTQGGQSADDDGFLWSELTPFWTDSVAAAYQPIHSSDNFPGFVTGAGTTGGAMGRYGADKTPKTGNHMVHYFRPNTTSMIYGSDELMELLNLWGTPGRTRLETALPGTLAHNSEGSSASKALYYKSFFTTYSAVSGARPRNRSSNSGVAEEPFGPLYVQADLDRSSSDEILKAMSASGSGMTEVELKQIAANLESFRNKSHKPRHVSAGGQSTYSVDAQPFLNEVYVELQNPGAAADEPKQYKVYVELANPYEFSLKKNDSYTKLTIGSKGTTEIPLPASIPGRAVNSWASGIIAQTAQNITVPVGESATDYLQPVQLYNTADNGTSIVIDRYKTISLDAGMSMQRKTLGGTRRDGAATLFFNGWAANESVGNQTCKNGYEANVAGSSPARPIENRSVEKELSELKVEDRTGPFEPDDMAFRRVGDIGRLLRFGHDAPGATNGKTATEKLAAVSADKDAYVDLTTAKYRRLIGVMAVNHPYYDYYDNDGDSLQDSADNGKGRDDILGPEIYRHGMINVKTAPPEVLRGMIPAVQAEKHGHNAWSMAGAIARAAGSFDTPADILTVANHETIFLSDNCDDDNNGAPDDQAERTWLYGYMSNWATVRTDTFAVYGTIRVATPGGRVEGVRRFIAVLDRVPATAYPPIVENADGKSVPNDNYLPVRLANFIWLQ